MSDAVICGITQEVRNDVIATLAAQIRDHGTGVEHADH
jgi:hypothetical protein